MTASAIKPMDILAPELSWEGFYNTEGYGYEEYVYTKDRLFAEELENFRELVENNLNLYLTYPDIFLDTIKSKSSTMELFFYQRVFLRVSLRFRYVFSTFTRAFSKSFLAILSMILRCVFLPNSRVFVCAEIKEQAARIAKQKIMEIFNNWPLLKEETYFEAKKVPKGKGCSFAADYVELNFKNGSQFQVVGMANSTRGDRKHAGIIEEVRDIDPTELNEVILPLMNITRRDPLGRVNPREPHQAQLFITTADVKASFTYEKLIEVLTMSVLYPEDYFAWGGTYEIPVMHGLLDIKYINEIKMSDTYDDETFAREYLSIYTGGSSMTFFNYDKMLTHRKIVNAEYEYKSSQNAEMFYLISVDVARLRAETAITIFKVLPNNGKYQIKVVNGIKMKEMHFQDQAIILKELLAGFKCEHMVIDGSGLGVGLLDFMIMETTDAEGNIFPPIGVRNDEDYLKKQPAHAKKIIHVVKSANKADEIHLNASRMLGAGQVDFLITEREAKAKLSQLKKYQNMYYNEKMQMLEPYKYTTELIEETCNWRQKPNSNKVSLEKINKQKSSDKFSSMEYGLKILDELEDVYTTEFNRRGQSSGLMLIIN